MRGIFTGILLLIVQFASAQTQQAPYKEERIRWVDNEVLVRFGDSYNIQPKENAFTNENIREALSDQAIRKIEQLFPQRGENQPTGSFSSPLGQQVEQPPLENIYRIAFADSPRTDVLNMVDALEALDEVVYAEPNYQYEAIGSHTNNDPLRKQQYNVSGIQADTVQGLIAADSSKSDSSQVIAILDTGVDFDHEDLMNKIWKNSQEINGSNGVDDDKNGFKDDTLGWDFISRKPNPMDNNGHGTHCAGIAAAETDNNKGLVGVSPGAEIMPVKVLQSSGFGNAADIAKGINYAANNGADVISMSLGGPAPSQVVQNALAVAYTTSFPVAAAGNAGICIGPGICPDGKKSTRNFPAAYSYVLGVESTNSANRRSGFSNYDQDGAQSSAFPQLYNYEVAAPGSRIISTLPEASANPSTTYGGKSGTSMAAPAVSGGIALMNALDSTYTNEQLFVRLIRTQKTNVQLLDAYDYKMPSKLSYVSKTVVDTLPGGDQDNRADAGETVQLVMDIKNLGGFNDSIYASIRLDSLTNSSLVDFQDSVAFFGGASSYAVVKNNLPDSGYYPFKFKLDSSIANARVLSFKVDLYTADSSFTGTESFTLTVQNGKEFQAGFYPGKTTLYPENQYLISGNTVFDTLVIEPGTEIRVEQNVSIGAYKITAIGKPDSIIKVRGVRGRPWKGFEDFDKYSFDTGGFVSASRLRYVRIENSGYFGSMAEVSHCLFNNNASFEPGFEAPNLKTRKINVRPGLFTPDLEYKIPRAYDRFGNFLGPAKVKNNVWLNESSIQGYGINDNNYGFPSFPEDSVTTDTSFRGIDTIVYKNFVKVDSVTERYGANLFANNYSTRGTYGIGNSSKQKIPKVTVLNHYTPNYPSGRAPKFSAGLLGNSSLAPEPYEGLYLGGKSPAFKKYTVNDYFDNSRLRIADKTTFRDTATSQPHGYVVDIRLDSVSTHYMDNPYNSQGGTGVIGPGKHTFTVEFNRPMDTTVNPNVAFGVRKPFTQNPVNNNPRWSSSGRKFSADITIDALTQSDGINRISVYGAKDNENFPAPYEEARFEFRLSASGALSQGLTAIGDTARINVQWSVPDSLVNDYLGANVYRIDSQNLSDSTLVGGRMQLDSALVDSNVKAGKWYGYYYEPVKTDLTTLKQSDTVWAQPFKGKPEPKTLPVKSFGPKKATLRGAANPNFLNTDIRFQYGTQSGNYSTSTTWQNIGRGSSFKADSVQVRGLTPGTRYYYRVQARNAEGQTTSTEDTFRTKDFPTVAFKADTILCAQDSVYARNQSTISQGTLNYQWELQDLDRFFNPVISSDTTTNFTYKSIAPGNYKLTLTVTSNLAVKASKSVTLRVDTLPDPSITASGPTSFCPDTSVKLNAPTGFYGYQWNSGDTVRSITADTTESYTVTVTDAQGCKGSSAPLSTKVYSRPPASVTRTSTSGTICKGSADTLTAPSGPSSYQWSRDGKAITGAVNDTFIASSAGTYKVETKNSNGCQNQSKGTAVTVDSVGTATITAQGATSFCDGDSVTLQASRAGNYSWTTGDTTRSITVKTAGSYQVTLSTSNGCTKSSSATQVTVYPKPALTISANRSLNLCQGESVKLTASSGFASYSWSTGSPNQSTIVSKADTVSVTGTTTDGCVVNSADTTVTVDPNPKAKVSVLGKKNLCPGDSVTLQGPSGVANYQWSTGSSAQSITVGSGGTYDLTTTNQYSCSTTSRSIQITKDTVIRPTISLPNGKDSVCQGQSIALSLTGNYSSYLWSNGKTSRSISVSQGGSYHAEVTNSSGCIAYSDTVQTTILSKPKATVKAQSSTTLCPGDSVTLQGPGGVADYQWSTGSSAQSITVGSGGTYDLTTTNTQGCSETSQLVNVTESSVNKPAVTFRNGRDSACSGQQVTMSVPSGYSSYLWSNGSTTKNTSVSRSGSYYTEVTNQDGCVTYSDTVQATIISKPTATISAQGSTELCEGDSVTLEGPSGLANYSWSTGASSRSITVGNAGDYQLTTTNTGGCASTASSVSVTVDQVSRPQVLLPEGADTVCEGERIPMRLSSSYSSYQWNSGEATRTIAVEQSGAYFAEVSNANGCTVYSDTVQATVATQPDAGVTVNGSTTLCRDDSVTLQGPTGLAEYSWSTGATSRSITIAEAGDYQLTTTNQAGCTGNSEVISTTKSSLTKPVLTTGGPTEICPGEEVRISAPLGYRSYSWNTGATFQAIQADASGEYYVKAGGSGCELYSDTVTVTVREEPARPVIEMASDTLVSSAEQGNQWYYQRNPIPRATQARFYPVNEGNYTVQVTDSFGCRSPFSEPYTYSTTGLEDQGEEGITVYPNPAKERITIESGLQPIARTQLMTAEGQVVKSSTAGASQTAHVAVADLSPGIYFLLVETDKKRYRKRIVVQH